MKATLLLVAASLALSAVAFVPSASADTCAVADPRVETLVCKGPVSCAYAAALNPKHAVRILVLCDPEPVLP